MPKVDTVFVQWCEYFGYNSVFNVNSRRCNIKKYIFSPEEYIKVFESLGTVYKSKYEKVIDISEKYGTGKARFVDIYPLCIVHLDFVLNDDLKIIYNSSSTMYKLLLVISGNYIVEKDGEIIDNTYEDELLVTTPNELEKSAPFSVIFKKDQNYKEISISFYDNYMNTLYNHNFSDYWHQLIEGISYRKSQINFSVNSNFEIKKSFLNLLPNREVDVSDIININSKVYEIIFKLKYVTNKDTLQLSEYEKNKIESLKKYLDSCILNGDENISLYILSKKFSMNRDKIQKLFKTVYGDTIFSYYRKIRLEKALIMLKTNEFSIQDVAYSIGYASVSSFRIAFKKQYHVLPSKIKNEM